MKSKIVAIWMCAMLVVSGAVVMFGNGAEASAVGERPAFSGDGWGSVDEPYIINTTAHLQEMNQDLNAFYVLGQDIDASETVTWPSGEGFDPIGNTTLSTFNGSFDGQNHTITGLFINRAGGLKGLFGTISLTGMVTNVTLLDFNVTGTGNYIGGLVGSNAGTVANCSSAGSFTGSSHVGGLAGYSNSAISDSHSSGTVTATSISPSRAGGIVGMLDGATATISRSYSTCDVTGPTGNVDTRVGGAVGDMAANSAAIECFASGHVTGGNYVGGFVGRTLEADVTDSYALGRVDGNSWVGGFVGLHQTDADDIIDKCYSTGDTNGISNVGGFCGMVAGTPVISASYWDTQTSGMATSPGGGIGRTTYEMMQNATFAGWDFTNIWDIKENYTYPFFLWNQFNSAPIAVDDDYATNENTLYMGNLTANDFDPDGDDLTVVALNGVMLDLILIDNSTTTGFGAVLTLYANGTFIYDPNGQFENLNAGDKVQEAFFYHISDSNGTYDDGILWINVTGVNDPPMLSTNFSNVTAFVPNDWPVIIDPDISITDADDINMEEAWVNITANYETSWDEIGLAEDSPFDNIIIGAGTTDRYLHLTGTDSIANYTLALHNITFNNTKTNPKEGNRTITWFVSDGAAWSAEATSTITMTNVAPVAYWDNYTAAEDTVLNISTSAAGVLSNDVDADGNNIMAVLDTGVSHGTLTLNANGSFLYTPGANYTGTDSFTYHANDGALDSNIVTVAINITPVNDAPVAANDAYVVAEDTLLNVSTYGTGVLSNDADVDNATLTAVLDADALHGTLDLNANGSFTYTPDSNYTGPDTFTYHANDGLANSNTATVTITVTAINDAPVAVADNYDATEDTTLSILPGAGVLINDIDADGPGLSANLDTDVSHGTLTLNADGSFLYFPATNYSGTDSFTYHANDGTFDSNIATVTITVNGVDDAPVLVTIPNKIVDEAVLLSFIATAIDSDIPNTLFFAFDGAFPDGAAITAGGLFTWTPTEAQGPGFYNITVRVTDNVGLFDNQTFMVKVNEVNVAPVAADDAATVNEDSGPNAIPVLANDMDGDGDTLTVTAVTQGTHGTVAIAGGTVEYTPAADYFGTDSFTYTVSDGNGGTDSAIVTITVVGVNDPPTAADDSLTMLEDGGTQTILVLSNDGIAPDAGETLTVTAVTQGAHGTVAITSGGTRLTYGPAANWHGIDTFTYTVSDGSLTATATVTVTVTSVNDEPVITTVDVKTAISGEDYSVDYSATDADLDTLTWSLTTTADWLAIDPATGVLSGTAELGRFNVQITVSDGNGGTAGRTFVLAVTQLDTDSDGVPDINDAFPTNANETLDTDGDGTGNNADTDDDGDGVPDNQDAFPLNSAETTDTDRDGTGDNADTDDDGDGVPDADDPEPLNAAVTGNEYEPGWPYWYVLIVLGIVALIGLLGLAFVWYIMKKA